MVRELSLHTDLKMATDTDRSSMIGCPIQYVLAYIHHSCEGLIPYSF
jgi:hypothetical protein